MKHLLNLIYNPSILFEDLREKPTWLNPFIIVTIISIGIAILIQPAQAQLTVVKLQESLTPDQIEIAMEKVKRFSFIGLSLIPLFILIRWGIVSGLLLYIYG